jgi:flavorubredoxin
MKVVVVYESMVGNTKTVAEAIAEGLGDAGEVKIGTVDELSPDEARDAGLIVAGGPTTPTGLAKPNAHESLASDESYQQYGQVLPGEGASATGSSNSPRATQRPPPSTPVTKSRCS